jgi:hypothetical protein
VGLPDARRPARGLVDAFERPPERRQAQLPLERGAYHRIEVARVRHVRRQRPEQGAILLGHGQGRYAQDLPELHVQAAEAEHGSEYSGRVALVQLVHNDFPPRLLGIRGGRRAFVSSSIPQ